MSEISDKSCNEPSDAGPNQAVSIQNELEQLRNENLRLTTANLQLRTENQQLRTENQLKNALQPLVDVNQQSANGLGQSDTSHVSSSSALDVDWSQSDGAHNFPAVVLQQIFSHVTDTKTLLTCRLVSKSWQSVIENTATLMRKLTFDVIHPLFFLELTNIVPVIKAVKFEYLRPFTKEQLENMVRTIAPTLESVTLNFDNQWKRNDDYDWAMREQIQHLVSVVLGQCSNLKELRLVGEVKEFIYGPELDGVSLMVPRNITSLTMDVQNKKFRDGTAYKEVIKSLNKLSSLTLFNSDDDSRHIQTHNDNFVQSLSPVYRHMRKYPGVLKKFTYDTEEDDLFWLCSTSTAQNLWTKLYLVAGTHNVVIKTNIIFDLENLLVFDKTYPVDVKSCSMITKARYSYYPTRTDPTPVKLERIQCCTNLEEIQIDICYSPCDQIGRLASDELNYLWQLKNLRILSLNKDFGTLSESQFPTPLFAVRRLEVNGNVFDSTAIYSSISVYFPNLVELKLEKTSIPEDLFISLARLEGLVQLELNDLSTLTDTMFLIPQVSIGMSAIAPFTSLKQLKIVDCKQLTDKCLLYGIPFISTLQSFKVVRCAGITETGFAAITDARLNMTTTIKTEEYANGPTYTLSSTEF